LGRFDKLLEGSSLEHLIESISNIIREAKGKQFVDIENHLFVNKSTEYGFPYVISEVWEKTGLKKILISQFEKVKDEEAAEKEVEAIFEMVLNRLTESESKLQAFNEWRKYYYLGEKWSSLDKEIGSKEGASVNKIIETSSPPSSSHLPLTLNDYYRAMDTLSETLEHIEESLFFQRRDLFTDTELVLFDTTSTYFEEVGEEDSIGKYGFSKDHRGDRKQVVISLVVDERRIPITHKVWVGNTVDKKAFSETVKELKHRFGIRRAILVADRGCVSRDIIESIESNGLEYIVGMRMNEVDVREALERAGRYSHIREELYVKEVVPDDKQDRDSTQPEDIKRYIVCYDPIEAQYDKETREEALSKLLKVKNVKNLMHNRIYRKLIVPNDTTFEINRDKIKELEKYDGKWVLLTNSSLPTEDVAMKYKELWKVEQSFRYMKSFLKIRPIYHYVERRIKAHIGLVFLSLYSERVMENLLGAEWNFGRVKNALTPLKIAKIKANNQTYLVRTDLEEETKLLTRLLHIQMPKRVTRLS
jgi:transposase